MSEGNSNKFVKGQVLIKIVFSSRKKANCHELLRTGDSHPSIFDFYFGNIKDTF